MLPLRTNGVFGRTHACEVGQGARSGDRAWHLRAALAWAMGALLLLCTGVVEGADRKPNVIIILTDDQGIGDVGCFGASDIQTPNIDALAKRGVRFTNFYAAAPVCSPSRAALLTGRYPWRAGVPGNVGHETGSRGLPPEHRTIAEMLKEQGYATAVIGKWHLGSGNGSEPNAQGFDHSFGHLSGCIDNYSHFFYWAGPNKHDLYRNGVEVHAPGQFFPDLQLKEAQNFMRANRDRPFFIYYAANAPHYPYQGEPRWLERYKDLPYPRNLYAAFVSTMDERVGALMKTVDELGLRNDTVVIFQADHGHSIEERAHFGGGSSGGLRGAKFSLFEGGIKVPAIVSWPGKIPAGEERKAVAHGCDWFPTIAELCHAKAGDGLNGQSLMKVIRSAVAASRHEVLQWRTGPAQQPQWAVRKGPWKLLGNLPKSETGSDAANLLLVNLEDDPAETRNRSAEHPDIIRDLLALKPIE